MERQQFKTIIDALREKVWEILWGEETYPQWTSAFAEGSGVQTDWNKGSRVLFVDGNGEGMVSEIAEKIPNEFMSFSIWVFLVKARKIMILPKKKVGPVPLKTIH
jgi:uncharacterized protein YndB with AHSA1/START domain